MADLRRIRALIIDLDGVVWRGRQALPGAQDFFALLRARGLAFVLATNNATAPPREVRARLRELGVEVDEEEVLTSAEAAAALVRKRLGPGGGVLAIGEAGLLEALTAEGLARVASAEQAEAVVVGLDRQVHYAQLAEATLAIRRGALFIGTNPDRTFPLERGLVPGNGALLALLEAATAVAPIVVGKPEPYLFEHALERLTSAREETLVLGDRLDTDVEGGRRAGLATALVLTGVSRRQDLPRAASQPDWVFEDLAAVSRALDGQDVG
jgi:4-nitrophenyl phosphatase